jgi:putative NADPH-quinone reductase
MKKLIIIAQPSSKWFTHKILETYKKESESYWDDVDVLDLYKKENYQPYLEFEDMRVLWEDSNREKFQEKIKWADELVLIFPIWWGNMPAIMKNFIDTNFSAWFAYKFQKWSAIPKKLLKWKTAKIFTTCDWNSIIYNNLLCPMYIEDYLKYYILGVFWIEVKNYELYSHIRKKTNEEKEEILFDIKRDLKTEHMKWWFNKLIHQIID